MLPEELRLMIKVAYGPLPLELHGPARLYAIDVDNDHQAILHVQLSRDTTSLLADLTVGPNHAHLPMSPGRQDAESMWLWETGPGFPIIIPQGGHVTLSQLAGPVPIVGYMEYMDDR